MKTTELAVRSPKKGNRVTNLRIKIQHLYPGVDCENKFPAAFHGAG
jgi:hypothetical protein